MFYVLLPFVWHANCVHIDGIQTLANCVHFYSGRFSCRSIIMYVHYDWRQRVCMARGPRYPTCLFVCIDDHSEIIFESAYNQNKVNTNFIQNIKLQAADKSNNNNNNGLNKHMHPEIRPKGTEGNHREKQQQQLATGSLPQRKNLHWKQKLSNFSYEIQFKKKMFLFFIFCIHRGKQLLHLTAFYTKSCNIIPTHLFDITNGKSWINYLFPTH